MVSGTTLFFHLLPLVGWELFFAKAKRKCELWVFSFQPQEGVGIALSSRAACGSNSGSPPGTARPPGGIWHCLEMVWVVAIRVVAGISWTEVRNHGNSVCQLSSLGVEPGAVRGRRPLKHVPWTQGAVPAC